MELARYTEGGNVAVAAQTCQPDANAANCTREIGWDALTRVVPLFERVISWTRSLANGGFAQSVRTPRQSSSPFSVGVLRTLCPPTRISSYYS